ncbi:MAG: hypothetical protein K6F99_02610 [Lachnospiraceae bacterium]|nr:hypothetical protein [Lachnospiraceae bacterium]
MRYFDSEKNKAMWDKEMDFLMSEREKRKQEGFKPTVRTTSEKAVSPEKAADNSKPGVRRINLKELERIVRERKGIGAEKTIHTRKEKSFERIRVKEQSL